MSIKLKSGGGVTLRNRQQSDSNVQVLFNYESVLVSGGTTNRVVLNDAVYDVYSNATYYRSGRINVSLPLGVEYENLTPQVGSLDTAGNITRVASGKFEVLVHTQGITVKVVADLRDKEDEVDQPKNFVSRVQGTVCDNAISQIDPLINDTMSMEVNGKVFVTDEHFTPNYVRNPDLWCKDYDLTCISPWNNHGGVQRAGTYITPRHFIGATHYEVNVGTVVRAVTAGGDVVDRTVIARARLNNLLGTAKIVDPNTGALADLTVYTVDYDLPDSIKPCTVMPSNFFEHIAYSSAIRPPFLKLDQEEKALIADLAGNRPDHGIYGGDGGSHTPIDSTRLVFSETIIGGDSGNPGLLIVDGALVLFTVWTYGGSGSGTAIGNYIPEINQMLANADAQAGVSSVDDQNWPNSGGHYQVKQADFSAYPNFTTQNYLIGDDGAGNKSLWVESGLVNGRMSYRIKGGLPSGADRLLYWDTSFVVWRVDDDVGSIEDSSANDVATPDLATFGIYTFTTP